MTSKIDTNLLAVGQNSSDHTTATLQAGSNPKNQTKPANNNKNDSGNNSIGFCHGLYTSIIRRPSLFSRFEVPHDMAKQHTCSSYILKLLLFIVNVFISPFMLVLKSITAYIYPCITGSFTQLWYYIAKKFDIFSIVMFVDPEFMPVADSLGNTQVGAAAMCTWVRVPKLIGNAQPVGKNKTVPKMVLFSKNIAPNDVKQGGLGNCWLLAALSALAEQPHYIRQMFVTNQINPRGRYKIKMYCPVDKKTMIISIDDLIPCYTSVANHTVFSHPQGNEAWVLLIEKAFAKYAGSYHNLEGGLMIYALTAFTGCNGSHFSKNWDSWGNSGLWTRSELHVIRDPKVEGMPRRRDMISFNSTQDGTTDDDAMFEMVFRLLKHRCIVAAGSVGRDTSITDGRGKEGGIVGGHAYSILKAFKPHLTTQNLRLVQLRNPWGTFEWTGAWSDFSDKWKEHPGVKMEVWPKQDDNDGCFFMEWKDFLNAFDMIDVCYTGGDGLDSVVMQVDEDYGMCGPAVGCTRGVCKYYCMCASCYRLWMAPTGSHNRTHEDAMKFSILGV